MRASLISITAAAGFACWAGAAAEETTAESAPAVQVSGAQTPPLNGEVDLLSDYIGRGLTFSNGKPVAQARLEYDFLQGPYAGSQFSDKAVILNKETVELDLYGGYRAQIHDWSFDASVISWIYPHSRLDGSNNSYDILEAAVDVSYKVFGIKLWYDVFNYLGLNDRSAWVNYGLPANGSSSGSTYIDSHLSWPVTERLAVKLHVGHQFIRNYAELDYTDWLVGIEQTAGRSFTFGAAYTDTNANELLYENPNGLQIGRRKWLGYVRWTFP